MTKYLLSCTLCVFVCLSAASAEDGELNSPRNLTGKAGLIFKGVVSGIDYETDKKTGLPYTYVTFRQIEPMKDLSGKFKERGDAKLRIRLFGGLHENGTMTISSDIPQFNLGAVYVVFYTAGVWDRSPIVDGERGVFRVIKSRTLKTDMVFDYYGRVVVSIDNDTLRTLPLDVDLDQGVKSVQAESTKGREIRAKQDSNPITVRKDSIYSEENVERLLKGTEIEKADSEKADPRIARLGTRNGESFRRLTSPPMSLEAFTKAITAIDKKHRKDYAEKYSKVYFEGQPVQKERPPIAPRKK